MAHLRIGHTHLTHRYMMLNGVERRPPYCDVCQCDVTVLHILKDCTDYAHERRTHSLHGRSLQEILGEDAATDKLARFLSAIGLFFDI